ncbi:hypothetical protein C6560_12565 [Enterobacter sp. FS01]|nr:hypothetical protein C6560_12565 [Enterobacter sp. FS01]
MAAAPYPAYEVNAKRQPTVAVFYVCSLSLWERAGVRASGRTPANYQSFANTRRAASMVLLISSSLCATDIKPASNADGAR